MKKTILKVIILAFFILLYKDTVYAGDEISFTINNEPPQDALIVGRVREVHNNQNFISIDVVRIVVGKICEDHINLQGVDTANYSKGDGILFSAKFIDNKDGITQCRAVYHYYKVDLKTDNKVRILPSKRDSKAQAIELEWIVNTGEGTGGSNDMIYRMSEDDKPEFIYDLDKDKWLKNSFDKRYTAPDVKKELQKKRIRFCVVGGSLIVLVGVFCFTKRMHKKRLKKRGNEV